MSSILNFILRNSTKACNLKNARQLIQQNKIRVAFLSSNVQKKEVDGARKKVPSPRITLISGADSIQICTLDEAQKISKRRDLKLVKVLDLDTKTQRAVFKLMTGSEYHSEELKRREEKKQAKKDPHIKGEKLLTLTSKITEHDLNSKLSKVLQWLQKFYEVRVVINAGENEQQKSEQIVNTMSTRTAEFGKVLQKRVKDGTTRFQIMPLLKKEAQPEVTPEKPQATTTLNSQGQQMRSYHTMTVL